MVSFTQSLTGNFFKNASSRVLLLMIGVLAILLPGRNAQAQSIANYTFTTNATGSLVLDKNSNAINMSTGTTEISLANAAIPNTVYHDDDASAVINLPFNFIFMGAFYDRFSVNSNGQVKLGNPANATAISGSNLTGPSAGNAILAPITGDNAIQADGKVHYRTFGSAPNRVFVIEFVSFRIPFSSTPGTGSLMQVRLYESSNDVEYVYGSMYNNSTSTVTRTVGLASNSTATTSTYVATINTTPANTNSATWATTTFALSSAMTNLNGASDGARRVFRWTPSVPAPTAPSNLVISAVTGTAMTLNWTDNSSNELGFAVLRSTDNVNFTPVANLAANTVTYSATGLAFNTTYYWKVVAYVEGAASELSGSQATNACTFAAGTYTIGPSGTYASLTAALAAMTPLGITGPVVLELQPAYVGTVETYPIVLGTQGCASAVNTITIRPQSGATALSISSNSTTATLDINGGNYFVIDGRPGGTGTTSQLTIANTSTSGIATRFINEGSNNTLRYLTITGVNTSTTSGVVVFGSTTGANGNDNNTIINSTLREGATTPVNIIYALGNTTTTAQNNSGNIISDNNILNFASASSSTAGIQIGAGNTDWTISGNSLYQTATRTPTTGAAHYGILINNTGNNFVVSGNVIGGSAPNAGGSAWTVNGTAGNRFAGISLSVGSTTASSVQGNTIANMNWTSSSGTTGIPGVWCGIYLGSGIANIGTVTGNTIGSGTGNGSIVITTSVSGAVGVGIGTGTTSTGNVTIANNTIGSIDVAGSTSTITHSFNAIWNGGSITGKYTVSGNTIGSTGTANSIRYVTAGTGTTAAVITGIRQASSPTLGAIISGNTIANLFSAYVPTTANSSNIVGGIIATSGIDSISGNTVRNLSTAASTSGTGTTASVIGISLTSTTAGARIAANQVYALSNTHPSANSAVTGINLSNATSGRNNVEGNLVYDLAVSTTSTTADVRGISLTSGLDTIKNNMVRLGMSISNGVPVTGIFDGLSTANSAIIFNSVYIGGTGVGTQTGNTYAFRSTQTTNARTYRNNIFVNARSNGSTGGKHYAVGVAGTFPNATGLVLNNNVYQATGTGAVFGLAGAADVSSFASWKTTTGADAASFDNDPQFVNPTAAIPDLHINTSSPTVAEGTGFDFPAVTVDYDNQTRSGLTPVDIGADAFNGSSPVPVISFNSLTPGTATQCTATARNVSVNVTTPAGTITGVTITYNNGTLNSNVAMTNTSGNTWEFSIPAASPGNSNVTWSVSATNSLGITAVYNGASYKDEPLFGLTVATRANDTTICNGSSVQLTAVLPSFDKTLGAGATTGSSYDAIFYHLYGGNKSQYLIRASELSAIGITAGNLTSLGINMGTASGFNYQNFSIKLAQTSNTDMTGGLLSSGFTTVYTGTGTGGGFAPVSGINTFTITPFNWNGTSNLVVEFCWTNNNGGGTSSYARVDAPGFVSCAYYRADNQDGATLCGATTATGTTSNRPQFIFGQPANSTVSWSDGTQNVGSGTTITVTPGTTTTYTPTVTLLGCNFPGSSVTGLEVIVSPLPPAPTTGSFPSAQCGTGVPSGFVANGADGQYRWYLAPTGGTPLPNEDSASLKAYSIAATTDFYVAINDGTCESPRTQVTANVAIPDSVFAVATPAVVCIGSSVGLSYTQNGSNNNYTVTWTATPAAGSGIPTSETTSPVTITPTATGTYTYLLSAVDGACTTSDTVQVSVRALPVVNRPLSAVPATLCAGGSAQLTATTNTISAATDSIGSNATTGTTYDAIFYHLYGGNKAQFLIRASELTARGYTAGPINSLGISMATVTSVNYQGFAISMAQTSNTDMAGGILSSGFTTVFTGTGTNTGYTPVTGLNTFNITPFNWNGTSNIVIQFCWSNNNTGGTDNFARVVSPGFVSCAYYRADSQSPSAICGGTSATGTTSLRPIFFLNGNKQSVGAGNLNWSWDNGAGSGNQVTVTPTTTTLYTVTGSDAAGCADTAQVQVLVNDLPEAPIGTNSQQCGTGVPTVSVQTGGANGSGVFKWYLEATGGTALPGETGTTLSSYTISTPTSFWVSEIGVNGCESPRTQVDVTFDLIPDEIQLSAPATVCIGSPLSFTVNQTGGSNTYLFSYTASPAAGSGINTPAVEGVDSSLYDGNITVTPTVSGVIRYVITGQDFDKGCIARDTVDVTVAALPTITSVTKSKDTVCAGTSVQLTALTSSIGSGLATIGTGALLTGSITQPTAFCNRWPSYRMQIIYTAAELQAAGLKAGNITAMAFNINTLGDAATNANFRVKIGHSALSSFASAAWVDTTTGFTTVYNPKTYTHTASGWQTIPFDAPFNWNGTSNIVVQVAHLGADLTNNSQTYYTTSASNMVAHSNTSGQTVATPSLSTQRLDIRFTGQVLTQGPGSYTWVWNDGAGSGNQISVTPATTTSYSVVATDVNGCAKNSDTVTVVVNPLPAAPLSDGNVTRCGPGSVTVSATGTGGTLNWYNAASGGTSLGTGNSYTANVAASTSFWVDETSAAGCPGPRTKVDVTVTAPPVLDITAGGPTTFCAGNSVNLDAATASDPSYVNFSWSPATGLSATNTAAVTANPSTTTTYVVTANDGSPAGCVSTDTVVVTVNPIPVISSVTATPSTICAGASVALAAQAGLAGTVTMGTGTVTSTTVTPYKGYFGGSKVQMLYTAAELSAAGLVSGAPISAVGFNITSFSSPYTFNNFSIAMKNTSSTSLTTTLETGVTTVLPASSFTLTGTAPFTVTHNLSTPFVWNGSNLLVEFCFVNGDAGGITSNSATIQTTTTVDNLTSYFTADNSSTVCSTPGTASTSTTRPNIRLTYATDANSNYTWVWSNGAGTGNPRTITPASSNSYTVTATNNVTGCSATSSAVNVNVKPLTAAASAVNPSICIGGSTQLKANADGGQPLSFTWVVNGDNVVLGTDSVLSVSPAVTTTYKVTVSDPCNNTVTSTVTVTVNSLPNVTVSPVTASICQPGATAVALTAVGGSTYAWSPATGLSATTGASVNALPLSTTTYIVTGTDANGCTDTAQAQITVNTSVLSLTASASPAPACEGAPVTLRAPSAIYGPAGSYQFAVSSGAALDPMLGATVIVSDSTDDAPMNTSQGVNTTAGNSVPIGFDFNFNGSNYTHFGATPDGFMALTTSTTPITSQFTNTVTSTTNIPKIYPYWDDMATGGKNQGGQVRYVVNGTAPNRIMVVEWYVTIPRAIGGAPNSRFQAWLYEGSNKIEFRYGTMGSASMSASVGITGSATQYRSVTISSGTSSNSTSNNSNAGQPAAGTMYTFTLPKVSNITWMPGNLSGDSVVVTPPVGTTTYTATANTGTCSAQASVSVTVNPKTVITADISTLNQFLPQNSPATALSITATGAGTLTYQWYSNTSNSSTGGTSVGAANGGQTNSFTPPTNNVSLRYYYAVVTGDCGADTSNVAEVNVVDPNGNYWTGNVSSNWSTPGNWSLNQVPTVFNDAIIPTGATPYPVLSGTSTAKSLEIQSGASVSLNGQTLNIVGGITATGNLIGSETSNLTVGANSTLRFGTNAGSFIRNLTVNAGTATLASALNVTAGTAPNTFGTVTVANGATLVSNGNLTFKSNINGTARLAQGANSGQWVVGDVTVERYIPWAGQRAWRFLSVPTKGTQTITQAWQERNVPNVFNPFPGYGTIITSPLSNRIAQGFDDYSAKVSMQSWSTSTNNWLDVTTTNNASTARIETLRGYAIYIRGDRSVPVSGLTTSGTATTLRTKGTLYTGNQAPVSVNANQFSLIGNTYVSAVDFTQLTRSGLANAYYVWDPKLTTTSGSLGAYVTFSGTNDWEPSIPAGASGGSYSGPNTVIQSGQAFMVQATGAGGSITFTEAAKVASSANTGLRPASPASGTKKLRARLYTTGTTPVMADANVTVFDAQYANAVDGDDAIKLANGGENLAIFRDNYNLVVEGRQPVTDQDTTFFAIWNLRQQIPYRLEIVTENLNIPGLTAMLVDNFNNSTTPIDLAAGTTQYNFMVTAAAASSARDRFRIVYRQVQPAPVPVTFVSLSANKVGATVKVDWKVAEERNIRQYEVERAADGRNFSTIGAVTASGNSSREITYTWLDATPLSGKNYYRIKSTGAAGEVKYTYIVLVSGGDIKPAFTLAPNPVEGSVVSLQFKNQPQGRYNIRLLANTGEAILNVVTEHAGGNSTQLINLPATIARGVYQVEIISPDKVREVQQLFINTLK